MNHLIYLSIGSGVHVPESRFSIHSAQHKAELDASGKLRGFEIVVYTDQPEEFANLPVRTIPVFPEKLAEWKGPLGFFFRAKICVIMDAIRRFGGACAFVDSDTYFIHSPEDLFKQISPGNSLMFRLEGNLYSWGGGIADRITPEQWGSLKTTTGEPWDLSPMMIDYNSGVIGLHEADAAVLEEALALADRLFEMSSRHFLCEQIAISACLPRWTKRAEAYRTICHYCCHTPTKRAFDRILPGILREAAGMPGESRNKWLYTHRPIEPWSYTLSRKVKETLKHMGLFRKVKRKANIWVASDGMADGSAAVARRPEGQGRP